jgi:hypothetical protein
MDCALSSPCELLTQGLQQQEMAKTTGKVTLDPASPVHNSQRLGDKSSRKDCCLLMTR